MCVIVLIIFPRTSIHNPFTIYLGDMNMKMQLMCVVVLLISVIIGAKEVDDETLPHWQDLECEVRYKVKPLNKTKENLVF